MQLKLPLAKTDVDRLDHALDRTVFRIFGCSSSADISYIRAALDISCAIPVTWHAETEIFRSSIVLNCVSS